jgi:ATP-dependent DNA helicase RecG
MIRLYDDHLSIWNPGQLAYQLQPEDLMRRHNSYPPNKLIAEAFYNVGIIERWGTGTLLIASALKTQQLPPPEFNVSTPDSFELVLRATGTQPSRLDDQFVLNDRQEKAIAYLRSHDSLTVAEYQKLFGRADAQRSCCQARTNHRHGLQAATEIADAVAKSGSSRLITAHHG